MANQPENTYNRNEASLVLAKSVGDLNQTGHYYKKLWSLVKNKELNLIKKGRYWYFSIDEILRLAEIEAQNAKNRANALLIADDIKHNDEDDIHLKRIETIIKAHRDAGVETKFTVPIIEKILKEIDDNK